MGLKSDVFQLVLEMWCHSVTSFPIAPAVPGGEDMGLQLLQGKDNPPANPNTLSVEPGLSPAREDLVPSFIKHGRKVCREMIKRHPQPGCIN